MVYLALKVEEDQQRISGFEKAVTILRKGEEKGVFVWALRLRYWLKDPASGWGRRGGEEAGTRQGKVVGKAFFLNDGSIRHQRVTI